MLLREKYGGQDTDSNLPLPPLRNWTPQALSTLGGLAPSDLLTIAQQPQPRQRTITWREGRVGCWSPLLDKSVAAPWVRSNFSGSEWLLMNGRKHNSSSWLASLEPNLRVRQLVRLARSRWRIELDYRELKDELGLDHYEGRHWLGWHHHVTLISLAYAFLRAEQTRIKKNFWCDLASSAQEVTDNFDPTERLLPLVSSKVSEN
jgi:hypothetical protein